MGGGGERRHGGEEGRGVKRSVRWLPSVRDGRSIDSRKGGSWGGSGDAVQAVRSK